MHANLMYHLKRAKRHLKAIESAAESTAAQNDCDLEQLVKDAAILLKQEACDVVDLACQDLTECLNQ